MKVFDSADVKFGITKTNRIKIRLIRIREDLIIMAPCMSSNGFGQIGSKTKRGFQGSYKPFLPFQQVSKCDSASFVKASFFV